MDTNNIPVCLHPQDSLSASSPGCVCVQSCVCWMSSQWHLCAGELWEALFWPLTAEFCELVLRCLWVNISPRVTGHTDLPSHWLGPSLPTILFMISHFEILLGAESPFEHSLSSPRLGRDCVELTIVAVASELYCWVV